MTDEVENLSLRKDELFKGGAPIGEYSLVSINRPVRIADPMGLEDKNYLLTHSNCRPDGKSIQNPI